MAQPTPYSRQYDFTGFSAYFPSDQQPGVNLDAEFNAVRTSLNAAITNLALIQRDDGALANASVTMDTLAPDVQLLLGANEWVPRGVWAADVNYEAKDLVSRLGATYVAVEDHLSSVFANELVAGKWILIYDSTAASIADGSITTAKLADGAVTADKVSFDDLTITGSMKAQTSLLAGTAIETAGMIVSGAIASGDAYASMARATRAQGAVGVRIEGGTSGATWFWRQDASEDTLKLYNSLGGVTSATMQTSGMADWGYTQRVTGAGTPATGSGIEMSFATKGIVRAYNRTGGAYLDLQLDGLNTYVSGSGTDWIRVRAADASVLDAAGGSYSPIGFRGLPLNAKTANYTLALSDVGKLVRNTTGGWAIPANGTVAFTVGDTIVLYNHSGSSQTVTITTDTLRLEGSATTGTRTIGAYSRASLTKVDTTEWVIGGANVT